MKKLPAILALTGLLLTAPVKADWGDVARLAGETVSEATSLIAQTFELDTPLKEREHSPAAKFVGYTIIGVGVSAMVVAVYVIGKVIVYTIVMAAVGYATVTLIEI